MVWVDWKKQCMRLWSGSKRMISNKYPGSLVSKILYLFFSDKNWLCGPFIAKYNSDHKKVLSFVLCAWLVPSMCKRNKEPMVRGKPRNPLHCVTILGIQQVVLARRYYSPLPPSLEPSLRDVTFPLHQSEASLWAADQSEALPVTEGCWRRQANQGRVYTGCSGESDCQVCSSDRRLACNWSPTTYVSSLPGGEDRLLHPRGGGGPQGVHADQPSRGIE